MSLLALRRWVIECPSRTDTVTDDIEANTTSATPCDLNFESHYQDAERP